MLPEHVGVFPRRSKSFAVFIYSLTGNRPGMRSTESHVNSYSARPNVGLGCRRSALQPSVFKLGGIRVRQHVVGRNQNQWFQHSRSDPVPTPGKWWSPVHPKIESGLYKFTSLTGEDLITVAPTAQPFDL